MSLNDMDPPRPPFNYEDLAKMLTDSNMLNEAASESLVLSYIEQYEEALEAADDTADVISFIMGELAYLRCVTDTIFAGFAMVYKDMEKLSGNNKG